MVKVSELLQGKKYQYKHIEVQVLEQNEQEEVLVFTGTYIETTLPNQVISDGSMEMNRTLWDQNSPKRPAGYWMLGTHRGDNMVCTSYFVSDEWLEMTPKEVQKQKRAEWKLG